MTLDALFEAVRSYNGPDNFRPRFDAQQWRSFGAALQPLRLRPGEVLIRAGAQDAAVYFIGAGNLHHFLPAGRPGAARAVNFVRAGAVVGEQGLFSELPHSTQVEAAGPAEAFCLSRVRFQEMSLRQPALAVETLRALGAVMVGRQTGAGVVPARSLSLAA